MTRNKDTYDNLYEYLEGLADTLDNIADELENRYDAAALESLNLSDCIADTMVIVRKAEDRVRRAL